MMFAPVISGAGNSTLSAPTGGLHPSSLSLLGVGLSFTGVVITLGVILGI